MNKDNAAQYLPLVQAVADGKVIQHNLRLMVNAEWIDLYNPSFTEPPENYRIKPEPREGWVVALKTSGTFMTEADARKITGSSSSYEAIHVREVTQ